MRFISERIRKTYEEIGRYVYSNTLNIDNYKFIAGKYDNIDEIKNAPEEGWIDFKTGDLWGEESHGWFKTSVKVPEEFAGQTIALSFHTFLGDWDNTTNPQFILYVNGEHIQGLDVNHQETILTHNAVAGEVYNIDLHAHIGRIEGKKSTLHGKLVTIDEEARKLYFNLSVPHIVATKLHEEDKRRIDMLTVLNDTINLIDLRRPFTKEYNESLKIANKYIEENFYDKMCGHEDMVATCVGHTHIDVAWLWTVAQTREKVARSFSTVLKLMEEYPEYIFMSSQPQLYKFLKEDHPKVYEKVKEKVREGVWEPEGAMWLEADCNVTSGESLIRQILHGKRFFKEEFNVDNEILWLPDVFGYSAALPQILKKSDVNYFMTTKISWNQINKMPYDTFMWKGIDGTEILTHFITTTYPDQDPFKETMTTYCGNIHPGSIMGAWNRYQQKNINNDVLVAFGFGDGGGGATYEMLENGKRLSKGIPGAPKVKIGKAKDYFKKLEETVKDNNKLPKWVGELYLEYHRGTYTSMGRNKRDNRVCENLYTSAEKFNSMAMLLGKNYPLADLNAAWETILLNQFHDILPGSSIKEVYDVTKEEYKDLIEKGNNFVGSALDNITSEINLKERSVIVFNSLGFERDDIATFDVPEDIENPSVLDGEEEIICQRIDDGEKAIFFAKGIPANGYKSFKIIESTNKEVENVSLSEKEAENDFLRIKFNEEGNIVSLFDKRAEREVLKEGTLGNRIQAFEDKPMEYSNWDIDIYYKEKMWNVDDVQSIEVVEEGPVRSTLRIERKFLESTIVQNIYVYKDLDRIDFNSYVDWKEHEVLLKTSFPIDLNATEATYEIQYGNVKRPTHSNTSWDEARFEVCGQKWADLSEGDFGISLLNNCKYGHDIQDGDMRLTLLKSGTHPWTETDQEEHFFTYSIYPHMGTWKDAHTVQKAYELNQPLYTKFCEKHEGILEDTLGLVKVNKDNIMIEVIKKAEDTDHLIIRMYEFFNSRTKATLEFSREIEEAFECNLMERNLEEAKFEGEKIEFTINPFEIKTFKVKLK
ncbi:alpha-mannosidase [Clostridium perfringens]|uniref:alpha-mannosidase n=1 Tax=Clostridium perfringens TaxID=1502 RepID=UPI001897441A|nr:alpha-mannosidase [Clostridium perfringens]MDK0611702.1 alpha-mannosidase [Clostridium perfringens]MDK0643159.1 alpha-mannosidase [Clostridium perfringens]MDK0815226.1 alpha-mannosidase [Clostridium perfringens]MDM0749670.1 alpha-mannosidase [Clostridium perfringens]MDM0769973.1 alpha-mannosidase [Clostridium perfringens]